MARDEDQWLFTEAELANTPSIQDGMALEEERALRAKGVNFIQAVGVQVKVPQITISTAIVFYNRFLMRASLKGPCRDIPRYHHFQIAALALFLATKVEESVRKMRDLIQAFARTAQKNMALLVDEQSKDYWRWKDLLSLGEDHMMEVLCFDFTVISPHRLLFDMLKWYKLEHNKRLRNAAWAFVTDSYNTQLCLLTSSRIIAAAGLYAAGQLCEVPLPDDANGQPWWKAQHIKLGDLRHAVIYMTDFYKDGPSKLPSQEAVQEGQDGEKSIYTNLEPPGGSDPGIEDGEVEE